LKAYSNLSQILGTLPPKFREEIASFHRDRTVWNLVLDANLPLEWHQFEWESQECNGRLLSDQAVVLRYAKPCQSTQIEPTPGLKRIGLLNLFPKQEHDFVGELQPFFGKGQIELIHPHWAASQLGRHQELFVVAHGTPNGLLDSHGDDFDLLRLPLPKRLWLLACNENRAICQLASQCLQQGVETVVVATGKLEASAMRAIIQNWLAEVEEGDTVPSVWLTQHRAECDAVGGIRALTVYGALMLGKGPVSHWNLKTLQAHSTGDKTVRQIDDNPRCLEEVIEVIESFGSEIWPVTLEWMVVESLKLAENHDHTKMRKLENRVRNMVSCTPSVRLAIANSSYRFGHYQEALSQVQILL
jgi:hypothetical protein